MDKIEQCLFTLKDEKYKEFHQKLMPTVEREKVIGIRIPALRKLAKELMGSSEAEVFVKTLPHEYYEENNLHAFLIEEIKDFDECIKAVDEFLPYIDNWATCDSLRPGSFRKNKDKLLLKIDEWLKSCHTYTVRFAVVCLMVYFLDGDFKEEQLIKVKDASNGKYYVDMAVSWYFATALAKQYECAVEYLEAGKLSDFVHNKTIQKAIESYRIGDETKKYLKTLKRAVR